jgi:hypothetical protein
MYFKTKNPKMTVKIPLVGLMSDRIADLDKIVIGIKRANNAI